MLYHPCLKLLALPEPITYKRPDVKSLNKNSRWVDFKQLAAPDAPGLQAETRQVGVRLEIMAPQSDNQSSSIEVGDFTTVLVNLKPIAKVCLTEERRFFVKKDVG